MNQRTKRFSTELADRITAELNPLIGCRVISVEATPDPIDTTTGVWPTLILEAPDGRRFSVQASRDFEGNGPGALFLEEVIG